MGVFDTTRCQCILRTQIPAVVDSPGHNLMSAEGTASFKVKGKSVASAQAHAIAQAYAAAYATAHTCHKCAAVSELVIKSYEDIFLKATSESTVEFEAITHGEEISVASDAFTRSFIEKTVVAFAEVQTYCSA